MYISKSVRNIRAICTPNDCSAIEDFPFLGYSCVQAMISDLWLQTCVVVAAVHYFVRTYNFVRTYTTTQELKVMYRHTIPIENHCFTEIYILLVRAVCKIGSAGYGS